MNRKSSPQKLVEQDIELVDRKGNLVKGKIRVPYEIANLQVDYNGNLIEEENTEIQLRTIK